MFTFQNICKRKYLSWSKSTWGRMVKKDPVERYSLTDIALDWSLEN
jgi:hypothetical protein